jgi:hypothetical protein
METALDVESSRLTPPWAGGKTGAIGQTGATGQYGDELTEIGGVHSPLRRAAERIATAAAVHWGRPVEPFRNEVMGIIEDELRPSALLAELHEFLGRLAEDRRVTNPDPSPGFALSHATGLNGLSV